MINLFRRVRKSHLMINNTGQYLKYAFGEIFLVVIGILIALQINNWNEQRKSKAFEKESLIQIRANLIKDKVTLEQMKINGINAVASTDKILRQYTAINKTDSIKFWLGDIIQFDRFQPLTNAYEVLKSKGLDQVSNKELRFLMGTYYDDKAKHIVKAVKDIEETFQVDWMPILKKHVVDFKFKKYVIVQNDEIFYKPSEIRNLLTLNRDNYNGSIDYIDIGITLIDEIINIINEELQ